MHACSAGIIGWCGIVVRKMFFKAKLKLIKGLLLNMEKLDVPFYGWLWKIKLKTYAKSNFDKFENKISINSKIDS